MTSSTVARRIKKRALKGSALFGALLLAAVAVTQGAHVEPAKAAPAPVAALRCDQNTVYGITSGTAGHVVAINVGTTGTLGATTDLPSFNTANNALGVGPGGLTAYATVNSGSPTTTGTINKYDAQTGTVTAIPGITVPANTYRGAVNPVNGIYYYAQGNVASAALYAYDPTAGRGLGLVGHINGLSAKNGDFAFSTSGLLYVVSGDDVLRVDSAIPTVSGDAPLSTTQIASLPVNTNSPGIAFSSDGYLYVATGTSLVQLNPSSGTASTPVRTIAIAGGATMYDLATCNYPDTIQAKSSVDERWQAGDQFALAITGNGIAQGNTATTTGSATGLQAQTAGSTLAVPGADYTVTQSVPSGSTTALTNYSTSWACRNVKTSALVAQGTGNTGTFRVPAAATADGTDVSCVFTNTLVAVHAAAVADSYATATNTAFSAPAAGLLANDAGTGITVTGTTPPAHGSVTVAPSGAFTYTPATGYAGADSFTYVITDSAGKTSTATVDLVVGPIAVDDQGTVVDGSTLTTTAAVGGVLANDSGVGLVASAPSAPAHGTLTFRADGSYTYRPTVEYSGPDSFTYTVTDRGGHSGQATVRLTVTPLAVPDTLPDTTVDTAVTIPVAPSLANDLGTGATGLSVASVGAAVSGTVQLSGDKGSFVYTPKPGASGTDSFTYTVTDGANTSTALETIRVLPVARANTAPATAVGVTTTIPAASLLANDKGTGVTIQSVGGAVSGTVSLSGDGSTITFAPGTGFSGNASFTYVVVDSSGGVSTPATVTVPVTPRGFDDTLTSTPVDTEITYAGSAFTGNDAGTGLVVTAVGQPTTGTGSTLLNTADGSVSVFPAPGYSGPLGFTYTATGADGYTTAATASLTVLPTAAPLTATVTSGQANTVPTPGLLTGATGSDLTASAPASSVKGGTITVAPDGSYVYTPKAGFSGSDSFPFTITDGTGGTAANVVTVTVLPKARVDTLPAVEPNATTTLQIADLLKNDTGSNLTVTDVTQPTHGSIVDNGDGTLTYTTPVGFSGPDSFTYTISDGTNTSTAIVRTTVGVAAKDFTNSVFAGSSLTVAAGTDDALLTGAEGGSGLTVSAGVAPRHGTVTYDGDQGGYTYEPAADYSGIDAFTYTVSDTSGDMGTGTVTITVNPKAFPDAVTIASGGTAHLDAIGVLRNDEGRALTVTSVGGGSPGAAVETAKGGSVTIEANGALDYTPPTGFSGVDTVSYELTDGADHTSSATVTFTVQPKAFPVTLPSLTANSVVTLPKAAFVADDLGSDRTVSAVGTTPSGPGDAPARTAKGGTVSVDLAGTVTYTPKADFSGLDSFPYTLQDGSNQTDIATATIRVLPTIAAVSTVATSGVADQVAAADGLLSKATGTNLTIAITSGPAAGTGSLVYDASGAYTFTPSSSFSGTQTVAYTITDGDGGSVAGALTITVVPKATSDTRPAAPAGVAQSIAASALLGNDAGSRLTITSFATSTAAGGTVTGNPDGSFTYRPAPGYSGPDSFAYTVTDAPAGRTSSATVNLDVVPLARADRLTTDYGVSVRAGASTGVLANDLGSRLAVTANTDPKNGTLTLNRDGSYVYTPRSGYSGPDAFRYTATDLAGQASTTTVAIRILPTAAVDRASTPSDTLLHIAADGVLGNDRGTGVSVATVGASGRAGGAVRTPDGNRLTIRADGSVDFVPSEGYSGIDTIPYTIVDSYGGTAAASFVVTVAPRAVADAFETPASTALSIQPAVLTGNDIGSKLHVTSTGRPQHGVLVANADGTFTYTPERGFSGTDSFRYTATDQAGQRTAAIVRIVVGELASDYVQDTTTGDDIGVDKAHGLLSNDQGTSLVASLDAKPSHGAVDVNADGSYVYTPKAGFSGRDSFTYQVRGASGGIRTGTVTITVNPTASPDRAATTAGHPVDLGAPGVLGNDLGSSLRVSAVGTPAHGKATLSPAGALVYTPAKGFSGVDTFTYTVTDSSGLTATSRVTVTVGILAVASRAATIAGTTLHVAAADGLLPADSGSGLAAAAATQPKHGTVVVAKDGSYTYTPAAGFSGTDSFTYRVTDSSGQSATATVFVTVLPRAVARADSAQGTTGKPVTVSPLDNDTPTSGAALDPSSVTLLDPATGAHVASFTIEGKGTFAVVEGRVTFTPLSSFAGTASIRYLSFDTDGIGSRSVITVVYPLLAPIVAPAGTPGDGTLAFTGSAPVGGAALIALLGIALGIGLTAVRRRRGPAGAGSRPAGSRSAGSRSAGSRPRGAHRA